MKKISLFVLLLAELLQGFTITTGDFEVQKYPSVYSFHTTKPKTITVPITDVLQSKSKNTNGVTMWITPEWNEQWYNTTIIQNDIINRGYTPVFIFYYFADNISVKYIHKKQADYFKFLKRFLKFLEKIDGKKIVILNPEYNENGVGHYQGMNNIFLKSFQILRDDPQVLVGPCVGDFGDYDKVNEPDEWKLFNPSLQRAAKKADFIAFQEMRALTRNKPQQILNTPKRAYNLAKYLHNKYHKPTMLAYLAISSYGKNGDTLQESVYKGFVKYLPKMQEDAFLTLFGTFHYFDYPNHKGYFKQAEKFFGVLTKDGALKPSFKYYNMLR